MDALISADACRHQNEEEIPSPALIFYTDIIELSCNDFAAFGEDEWICQVIIALERKDNIQKTPFGGRFIIASTDFR